MTPQEIFDTVVTHLRGMEKPSAYGDGSCAYRGMDGAKCAAGVLIPDEIYSPEMEGCPVENFPAKDFGKSLPDWFVKNSYLIQRFQWEHDCECNWDETGFCGECNFAEMAEDFGLTYPPQGEVK